MLEHIIIRLSRVQSELLDRTNALLTYADDVTITIRMEEELMKHVVGRLGETANMYEEKNKVHDNSKK